MLKTVYVVTKGKMAGTKGTIQYCTQSREKVIFHPLKNSLSTIVLDRTAVKGTRKRA
jgi:hypothetical protein